MTNGPIYDMLSSILAEKMPVVSSTLLIIGIVILVLVELLVEELLPVGRGCVKASI